jgi:putative membrane protein
MSANPYNKFQKTELILRDELAIDRTILANERTLMAYLRSGVALFIAGISMVHFSHEGWFWAAGIACLPAAVVTALIGFSRYRKMRESISIVRKELTSTQTE